MVYVHDQRDVGKILLFLVIVLPTKENLLLMIFFTMIDMIDISNFRLGN